MSDVPPINPSYLDVATRPVFLLETGGGISVRHVYEFLPRFVSRKSLHPTGSCVGMGIPKRAKRLKKRRAKELCELIKLRAYDWSKCRCIHKRRGKGLR